MNPLSKPIRIPIETSAGAVSRAMVWAIEHREGYGGPVETIISILNEYNKEFIEREEFQDKFDVLDAYEHNSELEHFNLIHVYPEALAGPRDGYTSARFFHIALFNTETMEYRVSSRHDGIDFIGEPAIKKLYIFVDSATLLHMEQMMTFVSHNQSVSLYTKKYWDDFKAKHAKD